MLQKLKGAIDRIDRTIAEEQGRQRSLDGETPSRSASSSSRRSDAITAGRRGRTKKSSADGSDLATPNPDPAVFEAAFVIDDSDEPSRSGTPGLPSLPQEKETKCSELNDVPGQDRRPAKIEHNDASTHGAGGDATNGAPDAPTAESSPELRQKLRKLEKLEATYPELLRSYRVAHRRATAIEPFEKALRENTPLVSIGDPNALVEYLTQVNLRSDMVMGELKKVSADKEDLKRKWEHAEERLKEVQSEMESLKAEQASGLFAKQSSREDNHTETAPRVDADAASHKPRSPDANLLNKPTPKQKALDHAGTDTSASEDVFSYDDEIPQLQAELESKTQEIQTLKGTVGDLQQEISVAKENSAGLAAKMEQIKQELTESRDVAASQSSLRSQLVERNAEVDALAQKLNVSQNQLKQLEEVHGADREAQASKAKDMEAHLAKAAERNSFLEGKVAEMSSAHQASREKIDHFDNQVKSLQAEKSESLAKINDLTKKLGSQSPGDLAPQTKATAVTPAFGTSKNKKNKKKRNKGSGSPITTTPGEEGDVTDEVGAGSTSSNALLEAQISQLTADVLEKDKHIESLQKKRKTEDDLREEIENLQENLLSIGQDHVEAKERIKQLEHEKAELSARISELQGSQAASEINAANSAELQTSVDALQKELGDLKDKTATLQSDLGASQQLAQSRFKELTELREVLQKAQPEIKNLRQESAELKKTKEELSAKTRELRIMERREVELKRDVTKLQQLATDREQEVKSLQEKLKAESNSKQKAEDGKRAAGRDMRRAEADKIELSAKAEKVERELQKAQEELEKLRPRVKELDEQMHKLRREKVASQEEVDFKTQQYTNAQGLLTSMRDQATEMTVQLKEARTQSESLEEELGEVQRLLQERTREGETMRRLLADVDERADNKVREMRGRMETAIEERDRIEDESSTLARRKARESEELKQKIRELEREVKSLANEKESLEERQREWKRRRDELESIESKRSAETEEMQTTISQLRTALDTCETQLRDGEKQRGDLRKMLDDSRGRYEKLARDLKSAQLKLASSMGTSRRSSSESARSGSGVGAGAADTMYIKTILLQFLEQKDAKLRSQLIPVLSKLLKFDKADEQKWLQAVQHIEVK